MRGSALLTFAQRTIHVANVGKTRLFYHHKPYPLEIKTLGDLLMIRRKQPGLSHKQLAAKMGIRVHWLRRWEFDRCQPSQPEWDELRKFLKLPSTPVLIFTQTEKSPKLPKTIGQHLRHHRLMLKLCLSEAALRIGVAVARLGLWELDKVFPKPCYYPKILAYLGYDPFPK